MKKVYISIIIVGFIALVSACSPELQTYNLDEEYATSLHYQPAPKGEEQEEESEGGKSTMVGVPARNYYGGDLKRGGIWWAGRNITLEKGEFFIFEATNVGSDSIPFGATFPPIDLTKEDMVVKISARAETEENREGPMLYMEVADAEGYKSNAKWPSNKIENSQEFRDYYFDLKDIFMQVTPKKHKVNGALINSLKFYINPGQSPGYTGEIFIQEIKVVPASSVVK